MVRVNEKKIIVNYENSIKKSNELSMAKLNHGLTLNQMQLLAYAIFSTQQDGKTEFHKVDFEKKFEIKQYRTLHAKQDAQKLSTIQFSIEDLDNKEFEFWNIFGGISYKNGLFNFYWNNRFIPHILDLKEKYITTDLTITAQFKSSFTWTLYDYIKAHFGYWHKPLSKEALMKLFDVENTVSYQKNTGLFKKKVLDVTIEEINRHTEFEVWYKEIKQGRAIVGFDLHWSTGEKIVSASQAQISELTVIINAVFADMFKYINLSNKENRELAIQYIKILERYREYTVQPICINKAKAKDALLMAKNYFMQLESFVKAEQTVEVTENKVAFYNWLEERE